MKMIFLLGSIVILLSACSTTRNPGGYFEDDGPHKRIKVDVSNIPDAVPRWERVDPSRSRPYTVLGKKYFPMTEAGNYHERGVASWYGRKFHGRLTALGERYDMYTMTAAHKTLPLPSYVRVRNLKNNRSVVVRVNDRGPFLHNRLIDLSYAAAYRLDMLGSGTSNVEVTIVTPGSGSAPALEAVKISPGMTINTLNDNDPVAAEEVSASTAGFIYLQIGAFGDSNNAENLRSRLENANFSPVLVLPSTSNEATLYRVRIGPLDTIEKSNAIRSRLAEFGIVNTHLVSE